MSVNTSARAGTSAEMNVTPLIDVLLVLIIIFMVVLPQHQRGEKADIPQSNTNQAEKRPGPAIVVWLRDAGASKPPTLKINQEDVAWDALEQKLRRIYQSRGEKIAFLKGDPEIDFEYVAQVVDMAHQAGAERVGLLGSKD